MSSTEIVTVPVSAARWITRVLQGAGLASAKLELAIANDESQLELRLLTVNQLKRISSELSTRTLRHYHANLSSTSAQNSLFNPPKSGAKKATWISTIAAYFHAQQFNLNLYQIIDAAAAAAAATTTTAAPVAAAAASARRPSPARGARKSPVARKRSPSKYARSAARKSPPKASSTSVAAMAADEAIARALQNRYDQEDTGNASSNGNGGSSQPWGGPLAYSNSNGAAASSAVASGGNAAAGLKRPPIEYNAKPKHLPAKVKKEPAHHATTNQPAHSTVAAARSATASHATASSASSATDDLQPRDFRETSMLNSLKEMGFTDKREILTALRAVAAEREEVAVLTKPLSAGWITQEQVEAAMMWIVSQREEAEEARKLDEARISSEQADREMEQSRKQNMEKELKNASLTDLLGSIEESGLVEIRSRHFPCSVLLRNRSVKKVLTSIASDTSLMGKDQVIRLLSLEKKARKWYGTVLPFSYFAYVLGPRFESWATAAASEKCKRLTRESDELERVMYNLSEQEEGGVGSVPKVFLAAQRDATAKGKPTSEKEIGSDKDVQVLQPQAKAYKTVGMSPVGDNGNTGKQSIEVIDLE